MDVSSKAYMKALHLLNKRKAHDEATSSLIKNTYDIADIFDIVAEAKTQYEEKTEGSKVRRRLAAMSSRIMYYGQIMDVISQHHAEYVSLAWGTMKFLFVLVLNHEETISELAKAFSKIGDVLSRVKLQLFAFKTVWMEEAAQALYVEIISFMSRCLDWYESSSWRHALNAFKDPYKLHFKDLKNMVEERARRMDEMAQTLSHVKINEMYQMLVRIEKNTSMQHQLYMSRFSSLEQNVQEVQIAQILGALKDPTLSSPTETLRFCQAVHRKRTNRQELDLTKLAPELQKWSDASSPSLVVIAGSAPARFQTKDLATEMVELLETAEKPVVWALTGRRTSKLEESTPINVLKQLIFQVIQLNSTRLVQHISPNFNAPRVESARMESDWLEILKQGLTGVSELYFIIDMEVLGYEMAVAVDEWLKFFHYLQSLIEGIRGVGVKIAILSFRQDFIRSLTSRSPETSFLRLRNLKVRGSRGASQTPRRKKKVLSFGMSRRLPNNPS